MQWRWSELRSRLLRSLVLPRPRAKVSVLKYLCPVSCLSSLAPTDRGIPGPLMRLLTAFRYRCGGTFLRSSLIRSSRARATGNLTFLIKLVGGSGLWRLATGSGRERVQYKRPVEWGHVSLCGSRHSLDRCIRLHSSSSIFIHLHPSYPSSYGANLPTQFWEAAGDTSMRYLPGAGSWRGLRLWSPRM